MQEHFAPINRSNHTFGRAVPGSPRPPPAMLSCSGGLAPVSQSQQQQPPPHQPHHERRNSEDASVDDSGRGGSVEDIKPGVGGVLGTFVSPASASSGSGATIRRGQQHQHASTLLRFSPKLAPPPGHRSHLVMPDLIARAKFLSHCWHSAAPSASEKVPGGQALHCLLPSSENWPAGQRVQAEAPAAEKLPAGHGVHSIEPLRLENLPAGHDVQAAAPAGETWPGWHLLHFAAPALLQAGEPLKLMKLPAGHGVQLDKPSVEAIEPLAHFWQFAEPELAAKLPGQHLEQAAAPARLVLVPWVLRQAPLGPAELIRWRRVLPMASNRSNKPAVDDTVPPASAGAVDSSAIPPATIGDASARPVEPTLSGASEKTPATPAAKKRSTTSGAARRRLNKARRAKEGGSQTGARGQRPAAAEASQSGAVAEEGLEPTEAPAQDREADAAGRVDSPPEESSTDPRASYADAAKRQPAVVILGKDARLSPDQLKQVRSAVDGLLWKQTLKGTPLNIHSNATRDSCLLIWPSDADSGRRLLELLPEQSWDLNLAFCREDERPRTKRHRIWVPARSVVTSADELRKGLLAVNRELPAAGLVVHDTLKRTDGTGFTAILGLSDAWMRRYPHGSFINVGLWKLRIRSYEADPPRGSEQGGRDAEAAGAEAQASAQTAKANRPARQHGRAGKAERAAEGGGDRRPARSTKRRGLYQRAAEAVRTAKISQLRREVAGTPRRTSSSREGGDVPAGPNPSGQGRLETDPPAQAAGCSRALGQSEAEDPMDGGQRAANAAYCLPANRGPFAEEEPMDTGDPDPKPVSAEEEEELLAAATSDLQ
uniref:DUF4780 domain-containing protein n=1 Tax=Macrostomum lignano TaxID=282301 RepID=A0A1I8JS80_9PLAT